MEVYDMAEVVEEVTNQTDHHRLLGDKLCGPSGNEVKVNFKWNLINEGEHLFVKFI